MPDSSSERRPPTIAGSPCLQGERVSFTGTLASMTHRQAHDLVEQHGGAATEHVSRQTTMLVVGEEGWPLERDGQPSQKLQRVTEWHRQGIEIRILKESEWLHLVGLDERRQEVHRLYTPAMLRQLLDVPVNVIRGWERIGLIKAVRKVYRLPYFDFQEVTGARRLAELLAAGVPRKEIEAGLAKLQTVLSGVDRPLAQLEVLARGSRLLYRDELGLVQAASGQRFFEFDPPAAMKEVHETSLSVTFDHASVHRTADDWFREGCRLLEENEPNSAVEAFRLCLMERPQDPEVNFFLAETLYRLGNLDGALERYYAAVERDHNYLEAWTQLGCLHAEKGQLESALEAFQIALNVHPDYPDAHLHRAEVLHQLGRVQEAIRHWQRYLKFDNRGPWAETARQRLEEAGAPLTAETNVTGSSSWQAMDDLPQTEDKDY